MSVFVVHTTFLDLTKVGKQHKENPNNSLNVCSNCRQGGRKYVDRQLRGDGQTFQLGTRDEGIMGEPNVQ